MESAKEESGLLHQILPPRLEDAGLEDCALPPDSIKEAFLKAASAVKSGAASIFSADDEDDSDCVKNPWPTAKGVTDEVMGIEAENDPPGGCIAEKGSVIGERGIDGVRVGGGGVDVEKVRDDVVVGEGGMRLGENGKACVDELQGLDIKEDVKNRGNEEEEEHKNGKRPTLTEGFL